MKSIQAPSGIVGHTSSREGVGVSGESALGTALMLARLKDDPLASWLNRADPLGCDRKEKRR